MEGLILDGFRTSDASVSVLSACLGKKKKKVVAMSNGNLEMEGIVEIATGKALRTFKKRVKGETVLAEGISEEGLKECKATLDALSAKLNSNSTPEYRLSVSIAILTELHRMGYTMLDIQPCVTSRTATLRAKKDAVPNQRAQIDMLQETNARLEAELKALRKG